MNYVRSHDDIGWTFADEDAAELGINGFDHRRFLNSFYVNRFPGSFARGVPFQDNPRTGDCRISGTTASLCGLEDGSAAAVDRILLAHSVAFSTGGIPLLYLGDEVGQLNDYGYAARGRPRSGQPLGAPAALPRRAVRAAHGTGDPRRGGLCRAAADDAVRGQRAGIGRDPAGRFRHEQPGQSWGTSGPGKER